MMQQDGAGGKGATWKKQQEVLAGTRKHYQARGGRWSNEEAA